MDRMMDDHKGKNVWWLYQARRINTQTNGAGGALVTRISFPAGQVGKILACTVTGTASAGSTLSAFRQDEDGNNVAKLGAMAAGASRTLALPTVGAVATTNDNVVETNEMLFGPGEFLTFPTTAALLNETETVAIVLLLSTPTIPTWDTTGSAGTPSLAASTISAANTLQAVVM